MTTYEYEPYHDPHTGEYLGEIETDESLNRRMEDTYAPDPAKPWRVAWGFGVFEDFASHDEAQAYADELRNTLPADGSGSVVDPFNAPEAWEQNR